MGKPTPTALRIIRGNPSKRPLPKDEPKAVSSKPRPPAHLSKAAKKHWRVVVKLLDDVNVMTDLDVDALCLYCETYAQWIEATKHITEDGMIILNQAGLPVQSPYLAISRQALKEMRVLLVEFGMTPSSRAKVKAIPSTDDADDPWSQI